VTLLARVVGVLEGHDLPHCLIGAAALAAHGVSRSTRDLDLLAFGSTALEEATWAELESAGVAVDVRRGDSEDPLAGVVRLEAPEERAIDVVVGRAPWQKALIKRARHVELDDLVLPVAEAPDLVLLKLYAGGPQDLWDIQQLLATPAGGRIAADTEARLHELPDDARRLWGRVRADED
jgi:hypothetical protein